ncbi:MAG: alpha/beta hydrolase, partial [Proteobacteria bacterium]
MKLLFAFALLITGCSSLPLKNEFHLVENQIYKTVEGEELKGDFYIPEGKRPMPAVLLVHGGGWNKRTGDMEGIAKDLAKSGYFVFNITYRLAPKHHFPDQVNDVKDAIKFLKREASRLGIDPNHIAGWGYS